MNTPRSRQRGLSMPVILVVMGIVIFIGTFAFKVGPHYLENLTVNKIVENKMADDSLRNAPRKKIYSALNQAYGLNNLHGMRAEDTVEIKKDKAGGYFMKVNYEKRANLFSNIDVVTRFEKEVTR